MANPTQIRPWSRFPSLGSVSTFESHTNPQIHSTKPLSLKERNTSSLNNNVNATKSLPPKNQSPTQSQKLKFTTFEPSKLKVNSEIETKVKIPVEEETKTVLVKESVENQKQHVNTKEKENEGKGIDTRVLDYEGYGTRVITIAGENRGAYMEITKSKKKPIHKKGNSESEEVNENVKDRSQKGGTLSSPPRKVLYTNSNVQCVNNSMLFHTSCTHNDPGLHLSLSKKPFGKLVDGNRSN